MEFLIIGIAIAFNIIVILWKFKHSRFLDAILDATLLSIIAFVFSGTYSALVAGTIASCIVSIYLLFNQPKLLKEQL